MIDKLLSRALNDSEISHEVKILKKILRNLR